MRYQIMNQIINCYFEHILRNEDSMKKIVPILLLIASLTLSACGNISAEETKAYQEQYSLLIQKHSEVVEAYHDLRDTSLTDEINSLGDEITALGSTQVAEIKAQDVLGLSDEIDKLSARCDDLLAQIENLKSEEAVTNPYDSVATIINKTGFDIAELYIAAQSQDGMGPNLVQEVSPLSTNQILTGVNFTIVDKTKDDEVWNMTVVDTDKNTIECWELDFSAYQGKPVCITIGYDDSNQTLTVSIE